MVRIESRLLSRCSLFIDCAEVAENKSQWLPACWIPALQCRLWEEKCDPRCCPAARRLAKKSDEKLSQGCPGAVPRRHCAQPRCRPLEALLASAPWPQVRAAARSPGLLALIPLPLVRVVARSESPAALLASAPSPLVQADARTPALLCSSARRKVLRSQELPAAREQGHVSRRRKVLRRHGAQIGAADDRSPALLAFAPRSLHSLRLLLWCGQQVLVRAAAEAAVLAPAVVAVSSVFSSPAAFLEWSRKSPSFSVENGNSLTCLPGSKGKNRNSLACLRNAGFHSAV